MAMSINCMNCRFWNPIARKEPAYHNTQGECRFNPPLILIYTESGSQTYSSTEWPVTSHDAWCGKATV